jgi:hypothetical protein
METVLSKIAITESADQALAEALKKVNQDFNGGRITKTDLASWFVSQGLAGLNAERIEEVRQAHFNQVIYLDAIVKKLKSNGQDCLGPDEIAALSALLRNQDSGKRRGRKASTDESQNELAS